MLPHIGNGELARRVDRLEASIQNSFRALDDRLTNSVMSRGEFLALHQALQDRVRELENDNEVSASRRWALAIALSAAILTSVIALVVVLINHV